MKTQTEAAISGQFSVCPLARRDPGLFESFVVNYSEVVQLAVEEAVSATDRHVFGKVRTLGRRAGEADAEPQDLIAVHLSALADIVKAKPHAMARACVRESRLLLVKMVGELAMYYREQLKNKAAL